MGYSTDFAEDKPVAMGDVGVQEAMPATGAGVRYGTHEVNVLINYLKERKEGCAVEPIFAFLAFLNINDKLAKFAKDQEDKYVEHLQGLVQIKSQFPVALRATLCRLGVLDDEGGETMWGDDLHGEFDTTARKAKT